MTADLRAQFLGAFLEESFEGLEHLEAGLLKLGREGLDDDNINHIFRCAHSLKGAAGTFGVTSVTELAHALETVLDRFRAGTDQPTNVAVEALLEAVDGLRDTLTAVKEGRPESRERLIPLVTRLGALASASPVAAAAGTSAPVPTEAVGAGWRIGFRPHPALLQRGNDPARILRELERLGPLTVIADLAALPALAAVDPEDVYLAWTIELQAPVSRAAVDEVFLWVEGDCDLDVRPLSPPAGDRVQTPAPGPASPAPTASGPRAEGQTELASIRIGVEKVDLLMNMVGELVITQSMLGELEDDRPLEPRRMAHLREGLSQLARNTRALQESVMRLRSMPMSVVFNRFPRLVHDIGRQLGKKVDLKIAGQHTELDKTVLEKLGDPLVHLVRNSLDHGLETPADRAAAGKPEVGTLTLTASHRGGDIVVEVLDDGRGIDRERILAKARDRGLVGPEAVLTETEILELIFAPGLSTAAAVTDLSGRGVGMDVVRGNVRALGGEVTVTSELGRGTRIALRLPLTLAIIDGQLIRVGNLPYVIPLLAIVETVQIRRAQVKHVHGQGEVFRLRDQLVPVVSLAGLLGRAGQGAVEEALLVIVEADGRQMGLLVDDLQGQQQVVVKSLEANYERIPGLAGATILGDGNVAFILDVAGLAKLVNQLALSSSRKERHGSHAPRPEHPQDAGR
jgi:two-component system chemotaxis sensor kinase CheA